MELNKGVWECRTIETRPVTAEAIGFPFAAQVAHLVRQRVGRKDEHVMLVTSLPPEQLNAEQWLEANRRGWGIENGLHFISRKEAKKRPVKTLHWNCEYSLNNWQCSRFV